MQIYTHPATTESHNRSWSLGRGLTLTVSDKLAHRLQQVKCFGRIRSSQGVQDNVDTWREGNGTRSFALERNGELQKSSTTHYLWERFSGPPLRNPRFCSRWGE